MEEQLNEMLSLMDRMNHPRTGWGTLINEGVVPATRVIAPDAMTFLTKNQISEGQMCVLGYIQLYQVPGFEPSDELYQKMQGVGGEFTSDRARSNFNRYMDRSVNKEWDFPTGRAKPKGGKTLKEGLYKYIIKVSRYNLHWQGQEGYARAQARKESDLNAITKDWSDDWKNEIGIGQAGLDSDAPYERTGDFYMEPHSQFGVTTYGKKTRDEFGNVSYEPINTSYLTNGDDMNSGVDYEDHKIKNRLSRPEDNLEAIYFGVYENGDIDPVPQSLGKILHTISSSKKSYIGDDEEKSIAFNAYYDFINKDSYLQKSFSLTNVAYICVNAKDVSTGVKSSKYWVNPKPLFLLSKTVNKEKVKFVREVNNEELEQALEVFAKKEANNLEMY